MNIYRTARRHIPMQEAQAEVPYHCGVFEAAAEDIPGISRGSERPCHFTAACQMASVSVTCLDVLTYVR
jgi:hypothetical protein